MTDPLLPPSGAALGLDPAAPVRLLVSEGQPPRAVLTLDQAGIQSTGAGAILQALRAISDDPDLTARLENRLSLDVIGYCPDRAAAFTHPGLRACLAEVTAHWPYWLHFLDVHEDSLTLLLVALYDMDITHHQGLPAVRFGSRTTPASTLRALLSGLDRLYEQHAVSDAARAARLQQVEGLFRRMMHP